MVNTVTLQRKDILILGLSIIVACLHGMIYVFLIPPWQHYDEPNHFEYVWLLSNRPGLPQPGDYDQNMRLRLAESMIENQFFRGLEFMPDLDPEGSKPIWIGQFSQLHEPPLYYLLVSIPLRFIDPDNISSGLIMSRLVSLLFFIITVTCAWGITAELTSPGNTMRILVPLTVALIPGFADLMTAVNNNVGAVAVFSLFLWGSMRMIVRGISIFDTVWVVSTAALCYWTKSTVYIAIPVLLLVFLFSTLRDGLWRRLAYSLLVVVGLTGLLAAFDWGDALLWARNPHQLGDTRTISSLSSSGSSAFVLEIDPEMSPRSANLRQLIPPETVRELSGQHVTLGAWMWASEPVTARTPILVDDFGNRSDPEEVTLGLQPTFIATWATLPENTVRVWISLEPLTNTVDEEIRIYYDDVVVAPGLRPLNENPRFINGSTESGEWGGVSFNNLIRNRSAELSGLRLRPWVDQFGMKILPDRGRPSIILYSLLDHSAAGWYYNIAAENLLKTFWAKFGWGHVTLLGSKPYRLLGLITILGLLGGVIGIIKYRKHIHWSALIFLGVVVMVIWGMAWTRGAIYLFHRIFIPSARYAYPVIIPTTFFLVLGWRLIIQSIERFLRLPTWFHVVVYLALMISLDIYAIISIVRFYA